MLLKQNPTKGFSIVIDHIVMASGNLGLTSMFNNVSFLYQQLDRSEDNKKKKT